MWYPSSRGWICLLGLSAFTPLPGFAHTFTWNGGKGTFSNPASWFPAIGGPPIAGDIAQFTSATAYTTTFSSSPTNGTLDMTGGDVKFVAATLPRTYTVGSAAIHG